LAVASVALGRFGLGPRDWELGQVGRVREGLWAEKKNIFPFSKNEISAVSSLLHRKIYTADKFMKIFV